ncbi:MAG TPA: sigma-54 dependent transcriptional regulator [Roseiarcus sp.]|nr:sigma-54 dependent transcriptional regulator [Roseiarcus sp.]
MSLGGLRLVKRAVAEPAVCPDAPDAVLSIPSRQTNPRIIAASALVFEDPRSRAVAEQIRRLAPSEANILIVGETGTGKELAARRIHALSRRRERAFVAVNCAAITDTLAESELFGHERGTFTGAQATTVGWFEAAHGGTLFLDEIGELSPPLQGKLLRVLQEREVVRVGSRRAIPVDLRLITATNVDLERAMAAGRFRDDLYYRIKVATISLPPLRDRPGDVAPLAEHFLETYRQRLGLSEARFAPEAMSLIRRYPWPGNIRELENVIHYALLVYSGSTVMAEDLNLPNIAAPPPAKATKTTCTLKEALENAISEGSSCLFDDVVNLLVLTAYEHCHGNQVRTAEWLGVSRSVLRAHLARLSIIKARRRA